MEGWVRRTKWLFVLLALAVALLGVLYWYMTYGAEAALLVLWFWMSGVYVYARWPEEFVEELFNILIFGGVLGIVARVYFGSGLVEYVVPFLAILHEELRKREEERGLDTAWV